MTKILVKLMLFLIFLVYNIAANDKVQEVTLSDQEYPLGKPGLRLKYTHSEKEKLPASLVKTLELTVGSVEKKKEILHQWLQLQAVKESGSSFSVWMLCSSYPARSVKVAQISVLRYILQQDDMHPVEFKHQQSNRAILPSTGAWEFLLPRAVSSDVDPFKTPTEEVRYLGHTYHLENRSQSAGFTIPTIMHVILLRPDLLIGVPHNMKQKDETRRYDGSDYEMIPLLQTNYEEMIAAGLNCLRVDAQQVRWIEHSNVYYWGIGGKDVSYPECLYKSNYIGPALFFDEPMVRTRDHVVRPKLEKDSVLRKTITPQKVLQDFEQLYHETKYEESPTALLKGLSQREDVDIGEMNFLQQNMYSWETMVSSALYQLSEGNDEPPYAMVFEPPGRFGTRRVLPELNMCFNCQIPTNDPKNLAGIIYGFLRGAARITAKEWGMSIYGAVDRSDTFWFLTYAYDLGASLFFYWDSYQLACVPYNEYLAMTRHLRAHARNFPKRAQEELKQAAEVAILLPPGYNLGHVYLGRGVFWGIPELHLERTNSYGVKYRQVMSNFYTEIERCIRLGVAYDLFWNLKNLNTKAYREVVTIREDGKVIVLTDGKNQVFESARNPVRPEGIPPKLSVEIEISSEGDSYEITAQARVVEGSAPVFYTQGADRNGIYHNQYVLWELFGPEAEDYYYLRSETWDVRINQEDGLAETDIKFNLQKPGAYRLRAATTDIAGRSTVVWKNITISE